MRSIVDELEQRLERLEWVRGAGSNDVLSGEVPESEGAVEPGDAEAEGLIPKEAGLAIVKELSLETPGDC